jgi:predicted ATPase
LEIKVATEAPDIVFSPKISDLVAARVQAPYTVLCGGNNSGKSLVLKQLKFNRGQTAYLVGPQRFYHIIELATQRWDDGDYQNWENQFRNNAQNKEFNFEQNFIDLGRILGGLKDSERDKLFKLCGELIGNKFKLEKRDAQNELSPRYVDMDGQNLAVGSTGTRLLMTLLGLCMDKKFDVILIDEPELGLSPRIQMALSQFFANLERRKEYFPNLKQIFVATHSHLFLDRSDITNNYVISKAAQTVTVKQLTSVMELHELQFNLLGNSLEALFLPTAIVIVEGKTDKPYIDRVLRLKFPGKNILTIEGQGDVKRIFRNFCTTAGDFQKSPFRARTFVVLDSVHTAGTAADLEAMGALKQNIVIWDKNGIEFNYPTELLRDIYACSEADLSKLSIVGDEVSLNGISKRKSVLSDDVVNRLTGSTVLPSELESKLVKPIRVAIGD